MNGVSNIVLRRATLADAPAIAQVRVDSWRATYRGIMPDDYLDAMQVDESIDMWERVLSAPANRMAAVFVVEVEAQIVGFAAGHMLPEPKFDLAAELTAIHLLPAAQDKGLGTRLLQMVAQTFFDLQANGMLVWTLSENKIGRTFYEKMGAELLIEQSYTWDDLDLKEVGYGWRDLSALALG